MEWIQHSYRFTKVVLNQCWLRLSTARMFPYLPMDQLVQVKMKQVI